MYSMFITDIQMLEPDNKLFRKLCATFYATPVP